MARPIHTKSAKEFEAAARKRKVLNDGGGLYLISRPPNAASWAFRYAKGGRNRWMGLGPFPVISLKDARERAAEARRKLAHNIDPLAERDDQRTAALVETAKARTFEDCALSYIEDHKAGWRNAKSPGQWRNTLETYAFPTLGKLPVSEIDTAHVLEVLRPIWSTKTETASRVRQRIERILDWAAVSKLRSGENPARLKGHLELMLPAKAKVARRKHHAALPYAQIATFMVELRKREGMAARALEFTILTAARTGEVIGATWGEINLAERVWIIPAQRMKAEREHRVPLSPRSVALLEAQRAANATGSEYVFPGAKWGKPMSDMAMLTLLERMGRDDLTVHGFRSTFRDYAAEVAHVPNEVAEMALAHQVADAVEAAYRRGDLFERRRKLMDEWATYCGAVS
jgi:integrase